MKKWLIILLSIFAVVILLFIAEQGIHWGNTRYFVGTYLDRLFNWATAIGTVGATVVALWSILAKAKLKIYIKGIEDHSNPIKTLAHRALKIENEIIKIQTHNYSAGTISRSLFISAIELVSDGKSTFIKYNNIGNNPDLDYPIKIPGDSLETFYLSYDSYIFQDINKISNKVEILFRTTDNRDFRAEFSKEIIADILRYKETKGTNKTNSQVPL
jgi:hypothetical protein